MIRDISERPSSGKLEIDLNGPQGNAFPLMGYATDLAKQLDIDPNKVLDEMQSGDYENLLQVFEKYFGDYVILWR
jgi:hypothetical protein